MQRTQQFCFIRPFGIPVLILLVGTLVLAKGKPDKPGGAGGTVRLDVQHESSWDDGFGGMQDYQIQPDGATPYEEGVEGISAVLDKGSEYKFTMSRDPNATGCGDPQDICYTRFLDVELVSAPEGWQDGPAKLFLAIPGVGESPSCDEMPVQLSARGQLVGLAGPVNGSFYRYTPVYNLYWTDNVWACELEPNKWWIYTSANAEAELQVPKERGNGWTYFADVPLSFELTATETGN